MRNQCCTRENRFECRPLKAHLRKNKEFLINPVLTDVFTLSFENSIKNSMTMFKGTTLVWYHGALWDEGVAFLRGERPARGTYPERIDAINCKLEPKSFLSSKFETLPVWTERDPKHMRLWSKFENRRDSHSAHVNFALWQSASCRPGRVQ